MKREDSSTLSYYEKHAKELAQRYENADVADLHRKLLETFSPGSTLLEIGCGSGREAAFLLARGHKVEGIDPSPAMIAMALSLQPELQGRLFPGAVPDNIPSPLAEEGRYDGIYAVASLMHLSVEQLPPAFELLSSLLKSGGRLLFSVPLSRPDLTESGYDTKGRYFLLVPADEWVHRVEAAGFKTISTAMGSDGMGRNSVTWLTCVAEK